MTRSRDVADTQDNIGGAVAPFVAGKNKIINGDFNIWQRGTSLSAINTYLADRWSNNFGAATTFNQSRQTFAPGTAPVAGYEGKYFWRGTVTNAGSETAWYLNHFIEDVQTLAGQTATLSFWAKADSTRSVGVYFNQVFGSGGSSAVNTQIGSNFTLSTSWTRYTATINVPSISGKTIGTSSYVQLFWAANIANGFTIDLWGVQLEAGSVATPFQTATGTLQGELAACQRYYYRKNASSSGPYAVFALGAGVESSTSAIGYMQMPVPLRSYPSSIEYGGTLRIIPFSGAESNVTAISLQDRTGTETISITFTGSGMSSGAYCFIRANNSSTAYIGVSAEL